jgi:hypothetical protein
MERRPVEEASAWRGLETMLLYDVGKHRTMYMNQTVIGQRLGKSAKRFSIEDLWPVSEVCSRRAGTVSCHQYD